MTTDNEVIEGTAEEAPEVPSAVLVHKIVEDNGAISVDVQTLGNVLATEVLTLLEMAPDSYREKIGLAPRRR